MFVFAYQDAFLALWHLDRCDLRGQPTLGLGVSGPLLAAPGVGVLIDARDLVLARKVVGRLRHGINAIAGTHHWINEAPSESAIFESLLAAEGAVGLGHDQWCARHAFDASSNH